MQMDASKSKPWQKFVPSPSGASPTASILKRTESPLQLDNTDYNDISSSSTIKRRKVKFTDPPVSEQVEIPRSQLTGGPGSGGSSVIGPNKAISNLSSNKNTNETIPENSYETAKENNLGNTSEGKVSDEIISDNNDFEDCIDVPLVIKLSKEPISTLLTHLTNKTFYKTAQKSLEEKGVETVADLCRLNLAQFNSLKGLKPPNNIVTIKEALRKFEKILQKREIINLANNALYSNQVTENISMLPKEALQDKNASRLPTAPFMESSSTPDEEDKALKEIYERPSPSPTEQEQDIATKHISQEDEQEITYDHAADCNGSESLSLIVETHKATNSSTNNITQQVTYEPSSGPAEFQEKNSNFADESQTIENTQDISNERSDIYDCPTQPIMSKLKLPLCDDSVSSEGLSKPIPLVTENSNNKCADSTSNSSEIATQTNASSEKLQIEDAVKIFEAQDVKTLSDIIAKLHGILQEKICQL